MVGEKIQVFRLGKECAGISTAISPGVNDKVKIHMDNTGTWKLTKSGQAFTNDKVIVMRDNNGAWVYHKSTGPGTLYITKYNGGGPTKVGVYGLDGTLGFEFTGPPPPYPSGTGAWGICTTSTGWILVSCLDYHNIELYSNYGTYYTSFGTDYLDLDFHDDNTRIVCDAQDNIYVTEFASNAVVKFDSNGTFTATYTATQPEGICYANDSIYVLSWGSQITKYSTDWVMQSCFTANPFGYFGPNNGFAIASDTAGNIHAVFNDSAIPSSKTVQVFDANGNYLSYYGWPYSFYWVYGMSCDQNTGIMYFLDNKGGAPTNVVSFSGNTYLTAFNVSEGQAIVWNAYAPIPAP